MSDPADTLREGLAFWAKRSGIAVIAIVAVGMVLWFVGPSLVKYGAPLLERELIFQETIKDFEVIKKHIRDHCQEHRDHDERWHDCTDLP